MSRTASGSLLSAIGMEFLAQLIHRAFPRLQQFRVGLGQLDAPQEFSLLFFGQVVLRPGGRPRLLAVIVKPLAEVTQLTRRQSPNPLFQFSHDHSANLPQYPP